MSPHNVVPAALSTAAPTPTSLGAPFDAGADAPICLDFLKGRCSRAQCRFLHPDLAQYEQLSGAVHARAGRRVCEVWAMTGQCKFGAKCSRLHPSVVPSPEPQQVLTLMLPLPMVPQAKTLAPAQPAAMLPQPWPRAAPRALPSRLPSPDSHPAAFQPSAPSASFHVLPTPTAPAATATPVPSDPRLPLLPPVAVPFVPPPPRPQHAAPTPAADPPLVGIQDLARSILASVQNIAPSPPPASPVRPGHPAVPSPAQERAVLNALRRLEAKVLAAGH